MPSPIPQEIKTGAETALNRLEGGIAAVLFGSRARDDWREESDWDIAFITSQEGKHITTLDDDGPLYPALKKGYEINCFLLPNELLRERCRYLGAVQRAIVRDGVVIAGNWNVESLKGVLLKMDDNMYYKHVMGASESIVRASEMYRQIASGTQKIGRIQSRGAAFVSDSADAAERLGKATLMALGIDPIKTHDMNKLADQASASGYDEEAELLRSLNGATQQDHIAHYEHQRSPTRSLHDAAARFIGVMNLYAKTIQSLPETLSQAQKDEIQDEAFDTLARSAKVFESPPHGAPQARSPDTDALLSHHKALAKAALEALDRYMRFIGQRDSAHSLR